MSGRIHELLNRNLQEVFGEGDAARRRAAVEELYTDDCVLYVPPGVFVGHDALNNFAGDLRATHPHFTYTPHGEPQALHNAGRLAWGSGPRGEKPDYTGLDVIIVRGARDRPIATRSPWQNGYAERLIGSLRRECFDHVIVFGERHLRHILLLYIDYYNRARTHLSLNKDAPVPRAIQAIGSIHASPILGRLHHHYVRI
jgi:hypothetical protein